MVFILGAISYSQISRMANIAYVSIYGNNICIPKQLGGATLLNLEDHMVAQRFNLLKGMCIGTQPWAKIIGYFVEKVRIYHGKTRITSSWWHVVNDTHSFKCSESIMVQQLVLSWQ